MDHFHAHVHHHGPVAVVVATGELDAHGEEHFVDAVRRALEAHPEAVEIELGQVRFIDSSGVRALIRARRACGDRTAFRLGHLSDPVARVLDMTRVREHLTRDDPPA